MNAPKSEMTAAVDRVIAALGLRRESFADQRDSAILDAMATDFEFTEASPIATVVIAQAANIARELEGYVRKVCRDCDREFWIVGYLAESHPDFDRCGRTDCVQASVRRAA